MTSFAQNITLISDMDDVLFRWSPAYYEDFAKHNPGIEIVQFQDRASFNMFLPEDAAHHHLIEEQMNRTGFYDSLEPADGAVQALNEALELGYDNSICSSPWLKNPTCASDKYASVERHFGPGWGERVILSRDKTRVRGDYLFDDKPKLTGKFDPTWEHVLVDQPHNRHVTDRRRIKSISEWRSIVESARAAA